jgi:hypothetical protein
MRHEEHVARVQVSDRIGRDAGLHQVGVVAVAAHLHGEQHPAPFGCQPAGVDALRAIEITEAGSPAERIFPHSLQLIRVHGGHRQPVFRQFRGGDDPLRPHPSGRIDTKDQAILEILVVEQMPTAHAPVGQLLGPLTTLAEARFGRIARPVHRVGHDAALDLRRIAQQARLGLGMAGEHAVEFVGDGGIPCRQHRLADVVGVTGDTIGQGNPLLRLERSDSAIEFRHEQIAHRLAA